jgi:rRNA maturation endonuclease Nob1
MNYTIDEEDVAVEEPEEGQIEVIQKLDYLCTACFDVLTEEELGSNKDNCPNCNETDCITER